MDYTQLNVDFKNLKKELKKQHALIESRSETNAICISATFPDQDDDGQELIGIEKPTKALKTRLAVLLDISNTSAFSLMDCDVLIVPPKGAIIDDVASFFSMSLITF